MIKRDGSPATVWIVIQAWEGDIRGVYRTEEEAEARKLEVESREHSSTARLNYPLYIEKHVIGAGDAP